MDDYLNKLRAAAEPTRLRLLALCAQGELTVTELTQILGQSQPRVSRHLKLMVEAGLLDRLREGTWAFYRLAQGEATGLAHKLIEMMPEDDGTLALDNDRLKAIKESRAESANSYFSKNAAQWDKIQEMYVDDSEVEKALLTLLPPDGIGELLDIGTGTGKILAMLGPKAEQAVGIDASREMLALARANLDAAGLRHCQVRHGDMYMLPVPSQSFDMVTVHQVLHYADDPAAVIGEAARAVRPGGRLLVIDFAPHEQEFMRDEHAHRRLGFSDSEMLGWFRAAGLKPATPIRLPGNPLTVVIWSAERPAEARDMASGGTGQRTAAAS
ncbi:MAG TPA: metalloregulator ArsR/SmtB family transcription factor [Alphaproteobacteria bacterium]